MSHKKPRGKNLNNCSTKPFERRKSKDVWTRIFIALHLLAWTVLFVSMLIFHRAQPEFETFFDRFYQLNLRTVWDLRFLQYLLYIIFLGLAISIFGLILSRFRARRKNDRKKQMKLLGGLYLVLFFIYWLMIWGSRLS
ncbi:MAG TPA: hypothetical protein VJ943_01055 [Desulfotignum sp.]|nr:hypothetical protein [Desulfotignum sp.]